MNSNIYSILNAVLFGIVLLEVLFQIGFSFLNKQKLKSQYFLFLVFTCIWSILRCILSIPRISSNPTILHSILDFIYPSINCSFLILSRHYITVVFQKQKEKAKLMKSIWSWVVGSDYFLFALLSICEWTVFSQTTAFSVIKAIGMAAPFLLASLQLFVTCYYRASVAMKFSFTTFVFEIVLNVLILIHFGIDLLNSIHVIQIYFIPNNLADILFVFLLEIIPINLILLLVYDFDIRTIVQVDDAPVPESILSEYMANEIVVSNPLLDYAYSRQDVQNMVIATNRSHKDSEEYSFSGEDASYAHHSSMERYNSVDKNMSPTDSVGSPLTF